MWRMKLFWMMAFVVAFLRGHDITIPLEDGSIAIRAEFLEVVYGTKAPYLRAQIKNQTSAAWRTLKIDLQIGALCNGEPKQWTVPITTSLGWAEDRQVVKEYSSLEIPLVGKVAGCTTEIIQGKIVLAENPKVRIDGTTGERVDLEKRLQEIKAKRDAEAAEEAERQRVADEERAKREAQEATRQRQLAAERKKKQAAEDARLARIRSEQDARAAEERTRVRAACRAIYEKTADKRVSDLTVKEAQQVEACVRLNLYPPQ
jgi:hypothetical protein